MALLNTALVDIKDYILYQDMDPTVECSLLNCRRELTFTSLNGKRLIDTVFCVIRLVIKQELTTGVYYLHICNSAYLRVRLI